MSKEIDGRFADEPECPGEHCQACSGEYCWTHHISPCDCDVYERHIDKPPLVKKAPEIRLNMVKWLMRRHKFKAVEVMSNEELHGDVARASGLCECPICGHQYFDHPTIEEHPELHVTCEWKIYKL